MRALALLTFPGVILRESLRLVACRMTGTAVFRGRFFLGTVLHEQVTRGKTALALAALPLAASYGIAVVLLVPVALTASIGATGWIEYGFLWLALSLAVQGAPGDEDARTARALSRGGAILWAVHHLGLLLGILVPPLFAWFAAQLIA